MTNIIFRMIEHFMKRELLPNVIPFDRKQHFINKNIRISIEPMERFFCPSEFGLL